MKKNVSGQKIGCQMVSATDGSAFTSAVTVYVTGDAGTQAAGSVGSGACAHEGNGYHTYAPAQAETNYDLVAFTFIGTGAVPSTVQVFTGFPQTGDNFARLGAPAGASVSADVAAIKAQTAAIETDTQDLQTQVGTDGAGLTNMPWNAAWDAEVQSEAADAITAAALATAADLATLAGYVDTEVAAILAAVDTEVAAILADTNELQTDLVNGGRLDLLIDAIKAKTDALPSDPADQSAVEAAITAATSSLATAANLATLAGYVDTEVAAIKGVTDKLDTAIVMDGAVYQFTANALELAPTGGSAPSAADIRAEIDANSTQLAAILEDTGTTLPASLATVAGYLDTEVAAILAAVDTEVAAIKAKTDNLPASPAAVGSEMVLTVAYDAAKTAATQTSVNDLPTNAELATALAGADDTVLAAVAALNNLSSAQAQSAAAAALTAYDPPTKAELDSAVSPLATASALSTVAGYVDTEVAAIKSVTDKVDTALEADGATGYQFTALALENAPTGGSAPSAADIRAEIDSNSTQLAAIVADTNELQTNQGNWLTADVSGLAQTGADGDTLETLSDQIDLLSSAAGSGATAYSITVQDENNDPIDGVEAWITTDSAGSNVVAGTLTTDAMGLVIFMLDAGDYYVWRQASGYNFTNPVAITVS